VECAGKTGTTNGNADGWFIGYTPELLAGTWLGCDDPFIRIYNTGGGSEMALPKWGYFMKKVYDNQKLPYGTLEKFEEPSAFENDPIYADDAFADIVRRGDSTVSEDQGNGDATDFIEMPEEEGPDLMENPVKEEEKKPVKDTGSGSNPAILPAEKKNIPAKKTNNTGNQNDYR
jgi:penicillin-binding protein 1A